MLPHVKANRGYLDCCCCYRTGIGLQNRIEPGGEFVERYLTNFDTGTMPTEHYDAVIIGERHCRCIHPQMEREVKIAIVTKETAEITIPFWHRAVSQFLWTRKLAHCLSFPDTLYAGAGLCDEQTVWALVNEAAENIGILCRYGVSTISENHQLALSREAAHSKNRIIH